MNKLIKLMIISGDVYNDGNDNIKMISVIMMIVVNDDLICVLTNFKKNSKEDLTNHVSL